MTDQARITDQARMTETVRLAIGDGLARITLNRPERLGALDVDTSRRFADAAERAVSDPTVRAVLLDSHGPAFCAGGDVIAMASGALGAAEVAELARTLNRGLLALLNAPVPVVAAAHGTTAGGGLGLLLCSDYAIVEEGSRVGALYSAIGLTPDLSVTALLGRAVGERRALQLVLSDRMLTGAEAVEWGLAAEAVSDERAVRRRAEEVAQGWIGGAASAIGTAKALVRGAGQEIGAQLEREASAISAAFATQDATVRIRAFAERRTR